VSWNKIIIAVSHEKIDFISDFLLDLGALSITLQDAGSQELFQEELGETPLWQMTQIHAFFDKDFFLPAVIDALKVELGKNLIYQVEIVADEDWVQKSQENFPAKLFGSRLWVTPPWQPIELKANEIQMILNPGLGFGTGSHQTTSLCMDWLAQQDLTHKIVIDYGCGSGILALAALSLGAKEVWAVDHDPQALTATENNAQLNHFNRSALQIILPDQLPAIKADIILANILANPLCELAPLLMEHLAPKGFLVLSGFLEEEISRVSAAYIPQLTLIDSIIKEKWGALFLQSNCFNSL